MSAVHIRGEATIDEIDALGGFHECEVVAAGFGLAQFTAPSPL